jgi:hypothetical protein
MWIRPAGDKLDQSALTLEIFRSYPMMIILSLNCNTVQINFVNLLWKLKNCPPKIQDRLSDLFFCVCRSRSWHFQVWIQMKFCLFLTLRTLYQLQELSWHEMGKSKILKNMNWIWRCFGLFYSVILASTCTDNGTVLGKHLWHRQKSQLGIFWTLTRHGNPCPKPNWLQEGYIKQAFHHRTSYPCFHLLVVTAHRFIYRVIYLTIIFLHVYGDHQKQS